MGLREDKKAATRRAISDTATGLFLAEGFESVTVARVAAAAGVSVNTVFNYFPAKEDLFLDRADEVAGRLAVAVRERTAGESVVAALERAFVAAIRRGDETLGAGPQIAAFWRVVEASPALQARLRRLAERTEEELAAALRSTLKSGPADVRPRVMAAVLAGVDRALHTEIRRRALAGQDVATIRRAALLAARRAYALAADGIGDTGATG